MKKKIKKIIMTFAMVLMVMAAVKATTIEAKAAELFDPIYYAQTYPDVAAALGTDAEALYNHYVNFGQKEGRIPYAGGQPGEMVDGIANATAETPAVQTPTATVDIGNGPFWLFSNGNEVDKATFLQEKQRLQQQFDAGGYVHVGWTEEQVQARLLSLKEQYPDGTVVGNCSAGAGKIHDFFSRFKMHRDAAPHHGNVFCCFPVVMVKDFCCFIQCDTEILQLFLCFFFGQYVRAVVKINQADFVVGVIVLRNVFCIVRTDRFILDIFILHILCLYILCFCIFCQ